VGLLIIVILKRVMIFLPPGAGKSTYASVLFPPERLGRRVRNIVSSAPYKGFYGIGGVLGLVLVVILVLWLLGGLATTTVFSGTLFRG
jgi:hypothetical protein